MQRAHHGEARGAGVRVSNACPKCGWFSDNINDWPKWVGFSLARSDRLRFHAPLVHCRWCFLSLSLPPPPLSLSISLYLSPSLPLSLSLSPSLPLSHSLSLTLYLYLYRYLSLYIHTYVYRYDMCVFTKALTNHNNGLSNRACPNQDGRVWETPEEGQASLAGSAASGAAAKRRRR